MYTQSWNTNLYSSPFFAKLKKLYLPLSNLGWRYFVAGLVLSVNHPYWDLTSLQSNMKESILHMDTTHSKKQMTITLIWRQVISSYMQGVCIHVAIVVRGLLSEQASKIHPRETRGVMFYLSC